MKKLVIIIFIFVLTLAACSPSATSNPIEISQATVVLPGSSAMGAMDMSASLAGYMQIKNNGAEHDRLLSVSCDFADAMMHETKMEGDVMKMSEVSVIDIPSGSTAELKTGGYHIMFMNLKKDLKVGDTVNLTLTFEKAGEVTIPALVESR